MRYNELCTLTESQIDDLLGLMKELNPELTVTPAQQRRAVGAPGTRIFIAENDAKQIVGCATLCVYESPTGRKASVEDVVVLPAYRGQGIGRTLLQRIIDFAGNKLSPIDYRSSRFLQFYTKPRLPGCIQHQNGLNLLFREYKVCQSVSLYYVQESFQY